MAKVIDRFIGRPEEDSKLLQLLSTARKHQVGIVIHRSSDSRGQTPLSWLGYLTVAPLDEDEVEE